MVNYQDSSLLENNKMSPPLEASSPIKKDGEQTSTLPRPSTLLPQPVAAAVAPVAGPRCVPTYLVVNAIIDKEDRPGPRCGHTLTVLPAVGEEGTPCYIGPRLIFFGDATALEENSTATLLIKVTYVDSLVANFAFIDELEAAAEEVAPNVPDLKNTMNSFERTTYWEELFKDRYEVHKEEEFNSLGKGKRSRK